VRARTTADGEALPDEVANPAVRLSFAQAAMASGQVDVVGMVSEVDIAGFHLALICAKPLRTRR
jgi:hypothetical protein